MNQVDDIATIAEDDATSSAAAPRPAGGAVSSQRFRPIRLLGTGNLGEVFIAVDSELNREVALKQIRVNLADNTSVQNRFCFEAEVTGGLEHPGIVPVYALGRDPEGRPYYAMRLIRGQSLEQVIAASHKDRPTFRAEGDENVALKNLLRRFLDVCHAMDYAHSRGVIHRDLKPSNVMVGDYGETLVVDWGLARLVAGGEAEADGNQPASDLLKPSGSHDFNSIAGAIFGTPAFMSPEQAEGNTAKLGPASDIHALGAMLYYLLTGQAPFQGTQLSQILSNVVGGRFATPRSTNPHIPRGLEAITLKAMATRPEDRYASAGDLANDIEAWLDDEPVSAREESAPERVLRWLRKHRTAAFGAVVILLTVTIVTTVAGLAIGMALQQTEMALERERDAHREQIAATNAKEKALLEAEREREAAISARNAAEAEADKARTMNEILTGIFQDSDPIAIAGRNFGVLVTPPDSLKVSDILKRSEQALQARGDLGNKPLVKAAILEALGSAYFGVGLLGKSLALLQESQRLLVENKATDVELSRVKQSLGMVLLLQSDPGASNMFQEAIALREKSLGAEHPLVAESMFNLALAKYQDGTPISEIQRLFDQSLKIRREKLPKPSREIAIQLFLMALVDIAIDAHGSAVQKLTEAKQIADELGEYSDIVTVGSLFAAAVAMDSAFGHHRALPTYKSCVDAAEAAFGPKHFVTGYAKKMYGEKLMADGRWSDARVELKQALQALDPLFSRTDGNVMAIQTRLAIAYEEVGEFPDAIREANEAISRLKPLRRYPTMYAAWAAHPVVQSALKANAVDDETVTMARFFVDAERRFYRENPAPPQGIMYATNILAKCFEKRGKISDAIDALDEALELAQDSEDEVVRRHASEARAMRDRLVQGQTESK